MYAFFVHCSIYLYLTTHLHYPQTPRGMNGNQVKVQGVDFRKNLTRTYEKLTKKSDLRKTYDKHVIFKKILQKSDEKLRTKLCKTYDKLTTTLQVSYKNVNFAARCVIRETLCQRLSLVEYFELKITDNQ